jgi:purine nucleoside phosphorylase
MSNAYDPALRDLTMRAAERLGIPLTEGVYIGLPGPSYETPAEVKMLSLFGGDVVGMSTVLEVIAARHMGLRCLAFSMVSNPAAGMTDAPIDHNDVLAAAKVAAANLQILLAELLRSPELV